MHAQSSIRAVLFAALLFAAAPLRAQDVTTSEAPPDIPFENWIAEAKRVDLPWSINISSPRLSILQRLVVEIRVEVPSKALYRLGPQYQLFLEVRMKKAGAAAWLEERDVTGMRVLERMPKENQLEITLRALILPGKYTVGLILHDRISGMRSVALRTLNVRPLSGDPLPELSRNLPAVEFFQRSVDNDREALPELNSRLWLPVATRRPVRIELLVNFTAPEPFPSVPPGTRRSERALRGTHERGVARMLGIVKVLSQMRVSNGTFHITAIDLLRRNVFFEQEADSELDWPRLRSALAQLNPQTIPVQALEGRHQSATFFREVLERLLRAPATRPGGDAARGGAGNGAGDSSAAEPLPIFIVVSIPALFASGSELVPATPPRGADFRLYYLNYHLSPVLLFDDIPRLLRELGPRRFELESPEDFRRFLARLLADLRAL